MTHRLLVSGWASSWGNVGFLGKWLPSPFLWRVVVALGLASVWHLKVTWLEGNGHLPQKCVYVSAILAWLVERWPRCVSEGTADNVRALLGSPGCLFPCYVLPDAGSIPSTLKSQQLRLFSRTGFRLMEPALLMFLQTRRPWEFTSSQGSL